MLHAFLFMGFKLLLQAQETLVSTRLDRSELLVLGVAWQQHACMNVAQRAARETLCSPHIPLAPPSNSLDRSTLWVVWKVWLWSNCSPTLTASSRGRIGFASTVLLCIMAPYQ